MPYITKDGTLSDTTPFSVIGWFWAIVNFFYLLFRTLIDPTYNEHGDKYVTDYRPPGDKGPPRPPTRKFGGFGPSGSGPSSPPMGGCGGCGCG